METEYIWKPYHATNPFPPVWNLRQSGCTAGRHQLRTPKNPHQGTAECGHQPCIPVGNLPICLSGKPPAAISATHFGRLYRQHHPDAPGSLLYYKVVFCRPDKPPNTGHYTSSGRRQGTDNNRNTANGQNRSGHSVTM